MGTRLRGPISLLALSSSFALRRPGALLPAAAFALRVGIRVRRAPVLVPYRDLLKPGRDWQPVCSLVSDTHLVEPHRSPVELDHEPEQWRWGAVPMRDELTSGLQRVLEHLARHSPRTVVWCGDAVDSGEPAEWREWRMAVDAVPGLTHRLVPGNHDICFNRPFDEDYELEQRAIRERAYQRHAGLLADFPVVDWIVGDAGPVTLILLDSCRHRSTNVLSNAIGYFGDDQLADLQAILDDSRGPVLCVAHHHVWRDGRFIQPDDWYNIAMDADRCVALLHAYRKRAAANQVLICHGHRHVLTAGSLGDGISVLGMPSTTLGDKPHGELDGIMRYAVAGLCDGRWCVAIHEVGPLVIPRGDSLRAVKRHALATR